MIIKKIKKSIKVRKYRKEWREKNPHNFTNAENNFDFNRISVGKYTYGSLNVFDDTDYARLSIGSFCSIANEVIFLLGADHPLNKMSTYPFDDFFRNKKSSISKGDIVIDDDVWIGYRSIILSNVHIGRGAVIGAGSVVTKDVPPYAIVGGNPAKIIKYRFNKDEIDELMKVNYEKIDDKYINEHINELNKNINEYEKP